jgi:hypothetical protein
VFQGALFLEQSMQLKVKEAFKWAHQHVNVQEHNVGDVIDTEDEDLIRVATEEGWAAEEGKDDDADAEAKAKAAAEAAALKAKK